MRRCLVPVMIASSVGALMLACHGGPILRGEQYAYRDAAHYYYPLYQKVQQEWSAGRWPLWDPSENAGMSLLGNPTAAVFYPGKLIFAAISYPFAARLYIVGHTLLAFATMLGLLRSWGTGGVGSALGGLAYAFGAPVLFQYNNVIYLVGAAWAPLGMLAADRWVRLGDLRAIPGLAAVLAMETLGGDPEVAYLTGFFAACYAVSLASGRRPNGRWTVPTLLAGTVAAWIAATLAMARWGPSWRAPTTAIGLVSTLPWMPWVKPLVASGWVAAGLWVIGRWRWARVASGMIDGAMVDGRRNEGRELTIGHCLVDHPSTDKVGRRTALAPTLLGLGASAVLGALLSAAQLLPVLEFAGQSGRVLGEGSHEVFSFSLPPIRVLEFLWPNASGSAFGGNRAWLDASELGGKPAKVWVPSLYVGGLTVVLALSAFRVRGGPPWRGWVSAVGLFSLVASFGEYASPIWVARHSPRVASAIGAHDPVDVPVLRPDGHLRDGDGGVYWAMATFLPGFQAFRFPSKLLTFTAIGLAAHAGQGWDGLTSGDPGTRRRVLGWSSALMGLTLVALVAASAWGGRSLDRLEGRPQESIGPLDARGALGDLRRGLVQGGLALVVALGLAVVRVGRGWLGATIGLAAMSGDLAFANAGLVVTVPQRPFDEAPEVLRIIQESEREQPASGPYRVHRMPYWEPVGWSKASSVDREQEFVEWGRRTQPCVGNDLCTIFDLVVA